MLDKNLVNDILNEALSTGGDFAEVFVENTYSSALSTGEGKVKQSLSGLSYGIGVRVFKDLFSTYAYTNVIERENLLKTARKAASGIKGKALGLKFDLVDYNLENKHKIKILPRDVKKLDKVSIMHQINDYTLKSSPLICRSDISFSETERQFMVANSNGKWVEDKQVYSRLMLTAMATRDNLNETAGDNFGGLYGFEIFEGKDLRTFAEKTAVTAISKLDAEVCPGGKMDVILNSGFGGVIFHEACGHSLEATAVAKNASVFCGKQGQQIASELVTAYDDATLANHWGSYNVDDEGNLGQNKLLIENGILKNYMVDGFNARRMGVDSNGCARRQNYKFVPTSRMSNTYIGNGKSSLEEIIAATDYGLFAEKMSGGSVSPASGEFNFSVDRAFIVEKGKIKQQVKGAKLIGSGSQVLMNVDMVGNNLDLSCGVCGSVSGSIPTTVGQPTIRVKNITVGGQK